MRGVSSLAAVAVVVSTVSGAIVPLHLMRPPSSHGLSSITGDEERSNNDHPLYWALMSALAGLTGPPPTATVHHDSSSTTSSVAVNTPSTAAESISKGVDVSMATHSPEVASSSSKMTYATTMVTSANSAAAHTLATSTTTSTPLPKTHTQSTRASPPTQSYVSFSVFIGSLNANKTCLVQCLKRATRMRQKPVLPLPANRQRPTGLMSRITTNKEQDLPPTLNRHSTRCTAM